MLYEKSFFSIGISHAIIYRYEKDYIKDVDDMGITIREIAKKAGVHRSTVDKVLHNRPGVSDVVRERIQKIIDESDYHINPIGKALNMQHRNLRITILLLEVDARIYLKRGIDEALKQYDSFQVTLDYHKLPYTDVQSQVNILHKCIEEQPDGIILNLVNSSEIAHEINACTECGIPVITVNTDIKESQRICFVGQDGFKAGQVAGRLMGEFLNGKGKVAVFTSDGDNYQSFPFGTREEGFRKLVANEYPFMEVMPSIHTKESEQIIQKKMQSLCENEPDLAGIFITCGGVKAIGDVLKKFDRRDIRLVCYESYPEILKLMEEGIVTTTLDTRIEEQGKEAMKVMMDYLIYGQKVSEKYLYSELRILVKESL